jgi:hypothetical protein
MKAKSTANQMKIGAAMEKMSEGGIAMILAMEGGTGNVGALRKRTKGMNAHKQTNSATRATPRREMKQSFRER